MLALSGGAIDQGWRANNWNVNFCRQVSGYQGKLGTKRTHTGLFRHNNQAIRDVLQSCQELRLRSEIMLAKQACLLVLR